MKFNGKWTFETEEWHQEIKDLFGDKIEILDEEPQKFMAFKNKESGVILIYVKGKDGIDAFRKKHGSTRTGEGISQCFERHIGDYPYGHLVLDSGDWEKVIGEDSKPPVKIIGTQGKCPHCGELLDLPF